MDKAEYIKRETRAGDMMDTLGYDIARIILDDEHSEERAQYMMQRALDVADSLGFPLSLAGLARAMVMEAWAQGKGE